VSPSQPVQDCLRQAFATTPRGVVGLTEQLLGAFVGGDVEFERVGDHCVCRWSDSGDIQEATVPLPPAAFRTILARIAVLCNERSPHSVTPYGGKGLLTVNGEAEAFFQVAFVNTPEKQRLELKSLRLEALNAVEQKPMVEKTKGTEGCDLTNLKSRNIAT
jgi:hypothetical protein